MASSDHPARAAAALAAALFALAALVAGARCFAATVRTKADMRLWETVADRTAPLAWPWTGAAESAEISFSNRLDGAVSSVRVARAAGETRGSCALPFPQAREALVDVLIVQTAAGGAETARWPATFAYVDGAGGGPIKVRAKGTRGWLAVPVPRVYAVDPAWSGIPGPSGYDIAPAYDPAIRLRIR